MDYAGRSPAGWRYRVRASHPARFAGKPAPSDRDAAAEGVRAGRLPGGRELLRVGPVARTRPIAVARANAPVHASAPVRGSGRAERAFERGPPADRERADCEVRRGVLRWSLIRSGAAAGRAVGIVARSRIYAGSAPPSCRCFAGVLPGQGSLTLPSLRGVASARRWLSPPVGGGHPSRVPAPEHPGQRYRTERGGSGGEDRRRGVRLC